MKEEWEQEKKPSTEKNSSVGDLIPKGEPESIYTSKFIQSEQIVHMHACNKG